MSEPIFDYRPKLSIVPVRTLDRPSRVSLIFDKKKGILEWPIGPDGNQGRQGMEARPWRIVGWVTAASQLPAGLTSDDAGKAWANTSTKAVHVWQGHRWHDPIPTGLARPGDAGPPVDLTVGTVTTLAAGSNLTGSISGGAPDRVLSLGLPRGAVGDKGPTRPASLTHATDYVGQPPTQGQALTWAAMSDGNPAGWVSVRPGGVLGLWSVIASEFNPSTLSSGSTTSTPATGTPVVIATVELAPQVVPYRLSCQGTVVIKQGSTTANSPAQTTTTRLEVQVDHGTGPIRIGGGRVDRTTVQSTAPGQPFDDRIPVLGSYASKLTPTSTVGVIPAGATAILTVLGSRTDNVWGGGAKIQTFSDAALPGLGTNLELMGLPV